MTWQAGVLRGNELGTLSVLFTDVVGSTAQRARLGDDAADRLHQIHDSVVTTAIVSSNGTVVKGLGDGVMATFPAAADAVAAGVAIQQGIEEHRRTAAGDEALAVRVGISIGDVSMEAGDVFGSAVVEASRLCGAATGDEILIAELVRMLARGRGGFTFEPVGEVELKGLPEPVLTCRVLWEPRVVSRGEIAVALPPPLVGAQTTGFVGRDDVLADIATAWEEVRAGGHRTVLLAGEPGIGKTRLASEIARTAFEDGATVLYGRCDEDLAVPYQPFVEALQHYVAGGQPGLPLGRLPGELVRLVPDLTSFAPVGEPVASDPRSEEFRLFEAVTSWLTSAARGTGLVLIVDDLHWAARPTVQMFSHFLRHAPDHAGGWILTVGTYRDTDVGRTDPLTGALADLRRLPGVTRHPIGGLSEQAVVQLVAVAAGHDLDDASRALATAMHSETEGNPFFVGEVLRHLVETGIVRRIDGRWQVSDDVAVDVPEGVRDVVGRRVARLSENANTVLAAAAVIGRELPLDLVTEVCGLDEDEVLDALDEAVRARLVEEVEAGRYRFAHALVRTTLYDELSATRARRMHRRTADALEKLCPDDVPGLANHLLAAGPDGGDHTRACRSVLAAGQQAIERRSFADAEVWFRQALELLDEGGDEAIEVDALIGLGTSLRGQGRPEHRDLLLDASRRARDLGATDRLVAAVLHNQRGYASIIGQVDHERVELIEAALAALTHRKTEHAGDDRLRARLTALLASELSFTDDATRRRSLFDEAIALAAATDDMATRAEVMTRLCLGNQHVDDPGADRDHSLAALALADAVGDPSLQVVSRVFAAANHLTFGDLHEVRRLTDEAIAIAADASPGLQWLARAQAIKLVVGAVSMDEARATNDRDLAMAVQAGAPDGEQWWAATVAGMSFVGDGGYAAIADAALDYAESYGGNNPAWALAAAYGLVGTGRADEARAILEDPKHDPRLTVDAVLPYHPPVLTAQAAFELEDARLAAAVIEALGPHEGLWAHWYLGTFGPLTYALGQCHSVVGDHARGVELVEQAIETVEEAGFPVLATRIRFDLARIHLRRDAGSPDGVQLLEIVALEADGWGSAGLAALARTALDQAVGSS